MAGRRAVPTVPVATQVDECAAVVTPSDRSTEVPRSLWAVISSPSPAPPSAPRSTGTYVSGRNWRVVGSAVDMAARRLTAWAPLGPSAARAWSVCGEVSRVTGTVGRAASVAANPSRAAAAADGSGSTEGASPPWPGVTETGAATGATQVKPSGVALFTAE